MQGAPTAGIADVHAVGSKTQQPPDQISAARGHGFVEGQIPLAVSQPEACAITMEQAQSLQLSLGCSAVSRTVDGKDGKGRHSLSVPVKSRNLPPALFVLRIRVGPGIEQEFRTLDVPEGDRVE